MTDNRRPAAIVLNKALARKRINELSKATANVIFTNHARERMVEREIFADEVYRVLRTGFVDSEPELTDKVSGNAR